MNNNQNKSIISVLILSIISISLIVGCISPVRAEDGAEGFTILSIDSTKINSNSDLAKANFTLHLATGGGQYVVGNFGNETFLDYLTNIIIRDPLKIEIGNIKEKLAYPILNQGQLFKYEYHYIEKTDWWKSAECDGSTFCFPTTSGYNRILAINRIPVGMYGAFGKPDISWSGKMIVTINGIPNSKDIGSGESTFGSVNFESITGEWIAHATWIGSLVTGQATPQENLYVPTYRTENKQWKTASKTYYDIYTKSLSETDTKLTTWKEQNYEQLGSGLFDPIKVSICKDSECSNVLNYITVHNINLDTLTNSNVQIDYGSVTTTSSTTITKKEGNIITGNVIDTLDRRIANPEIIMVVKASTLNPYIPVGIPQIESITAETFDSGDNNGAAYIKIKNIGDAKGTFSAYLTDESKTFTSQSNVESAKITLDKGESGTITMHIGYNDNLQDITKTGLITVYEVNSPDSKTTTTKDFIINMKSAKVCAPNEYRVYSNEIYKCNGDGTDEAKTLTCDGLLKKVDGKYICEEVDGKTNSNEKSESTTSGKEEAEKDDPPKENNSLFMNILYWLAAFLILTGIFIIANKIRNNEDKISKENINNSLLLAGIITALSYLYIQYVTLSQTLGLVLWIIVVAILIIVALANFISFVKLGKILPLKISIVIAVGLFVIITALSVGTKDVLCGNGLTSWIFSDCKPFNLMDYLFKGT